MASEKHFTRCIELLDDLVQEFLRVYKRIEVPSRYEADTAAFLLMEVTVRHVSAIEAIGMIPEPGSHILSAWPLLRSTFETSLTSHWLAVHPDWKEREARWAGWIASSEKYLRGLSSDLKKIGLDPEGEWTRKADGMREQREQFTRQHTINSRSKRPDIPDMIREVGISHSEYVPYRIASQQIHGGPPCVADVWGDVHRERETGVRKLAPHYGLWRIPLQVAGTCVVRTGEVVLLRAGANTLDAERMIEAYERLSAATELLKQ